jgi:hypothetical protein
MSLELGPWPWVDEDLRRAVEAMSPAQAVPAHPRGPEAVPLRRSGAAAHDARGGPRPGVDAIADARLARSRAGAGGGRKRHAVADEDA